MAGSRSQPQATYFTPFPGGETVDFDVDAFDDAIRLKGVLFEHHKAMRCPVGIVDRDDTVRRPHEHHEGCSNGFIYTRAGVFQSLLTGNGLQSDFRDQGLADSSTAQMTWPRFYAPEDCAPDANRRVYVVPYDRFYYADERILVPNWELVEASPTGIDRLMFPAVGVDLVIDARGERYHCGVDFDLVKGGIAWKGQHQPGPNPEIIGRGTIYSVRYLYRPFWYVRQMVHEIRVTQRDNPQTGAREVERMPQAAVVQREYIFLSQERDDPDSGAARVYRAPADGGFSSK